MNYNKKLFWWFLKYLVICLFSLVVGILILYLPRDSPVTSNGTSKTANIKTRLSQQVPADIQETEFFINLSNFMHYCARI